ncbi:MAG TPA: aldo/keto reductase [Thermoplasmata archaeon]|nr:aldo/keto reductase [Thermoplasmata archaeon]
MSLSLESRVRLNNGVPMPWLGLGVYRASPGRSTRSAVREALRVGYRLIDTAKLYRNEADVGAAVRESGLPREEIFVTTKLWNTDHGYDAALRAFDRSLRELGLEYVDLYLIHWPVPGARRETWKALEVIYAQGKAHAIGVSNYMPHHLTELLEDARVVPAVDQVEMNPFLPQRELQAFCRDHGIRLEAYSPLTQGHRLDDTRVASAARKHGKTPAQILLRWCLQAEAVAIPKSTHPERIRENSEIFDFVLDAEDLQVLSTVDESLHTSWDPTQQP